MFFSNVAALLPIPQAKYIEFDSGTIRCVANYVTVYGACMVTLSIWLEPWQQKFNNN